SLSHQPHRFFRRCDAKLEPESLGEHLGDGNRPSRVVGRDQEPNEIAEYHLVAWRELERALGRGYRRWNLPALMEQVGQRRRGASRKPAETRSLRHRPLIEVDGVSHEEAVEEIASVQCQG